MNLANMMLAFGSARRKEIAIRLAVGGSRSRIVRQLLVQGGMLSLAGGALGLLTATRAAQVLVSSMATVFPSFLALDLTPDTTVLCATMIFCSLATVAYVSLVLFWSLGYGHWTPNISQARCIDAVRSWRISADAVSA
jgi:putative ABC transport system permease protein